MHSGGRREEDGFKIGGRTDKKLREWIKEDYLLEMKTHSSYSVVVRSGPGSRVHQCD